MFLKLDYVFAPLSLFLVRGRVRNFYHFPHILLDILAGLTPLHLNKKYRKWTDIFSVKT